MLFSSIHHLKQLKKSNKITSLEHIPKDVKEMREMVFLFMQQHPLGRYFELEEETKYSGSVEKTNGLHFKEYVIMELNKNLRSF